MSFEGPDVDEHGEGVRPIPGPPGRNQRCSMGFNLAYRGAIPYTPFFKEIA